MGSSWFAATSVQRQLLTSLKKFAHLRGAGRIPGKLFGAQGLQHHAQRALVLIEVGGLKPGLEVRTYHHHGNVAASKGDIGHFTLVEQNDEQPLTLKYRAGNDR